MSLLNLLPLVIFFTAIFLFFKLDFLFLKHPVRCFKIFKNSFSNRGSFRALMLSLAGTLGVGNIIGVAFGISVGGAGSVFWLIISAFFSMIIKYAEATIALDSKGEDGGGMMYVIKKTFPEKLSSLSYVYAVLCLILSLTMGAALQSRSAAECFFGEDIIFSIFIAAFFTITVAVAIFGGAEKIEKLTAYVIPLAALIYIILASFLIFKNSNELPGAVKNIFSSAFTFRSAVGGISGYIIILSVREGFCRGLLSNEAGAGTSSMAHSRNDTKKPAEAGILGICEVFIDTVILCPLTALAVLCAVPDTSVYKSGMEIIFAAFSPLGEAPRLLLSLCIVLFAYSTIICWYFYGSLSFKFIFKKQHKCFDFFFLTAVFIGSLTNSSYLIRISDYLLFFMSIISISTVIKSSDRIRYLSEDLGIITKRGS